MTADARFGRQKAAEPLLTMADIQQWEEELRNRRSVQQGHLEAAKAEEPYIEELERNLAFARGLAKNRLGRAVAELPVSNGDSAKPAPEAPNLKGGKPLSKADPFVRKAAIRANAEHPDGFEPHQIYEILAEDPDVAAIGGITIGYIYKALKRLRFEGFLDKVRHKYVLAGAVPDQSPPEGFKFVPLSKQDRIRLETKKYLKRRSGSAHRLAVAEHLISIGIMGAERQVVDTLASYLSRWPEFRADGSGNYSLAEDKEAK